MGEGEGGVAGEGKLIGVPAFQFWGKCTMLLIVSMWCTWLRKCQSAQGLAQARPKQIYSLWCDVF